MKVFLALKVRKSVPKELAFTKVDFLDLVQFFNFLILDRFLLPPLALSAPPVILLSPALPSISCFLVWMIWILLPVNLPIIQKIEMSGTTILLKFLMNLL